MGRNFVQFGKTKSVLNKRAPKVALLFNPPSVLSLENEEQFVNRVDKFSEELPKGVIPLIEIKYRVKKL